MEVRYDNSAQLGIDAGNTKSAFAQNAKKYGVSYQFAIPAEGSATLWTQLVNCGNNPTTGVGAAGFRTPIGTYKDPQTGTEYPNCLVYNSEPNSIKNPDGSYKTDSFSTQEGYVQNVIDLLAGNPDITTPYKNPFNLGLALYALSDESVTGCLPGEKHEGCAFSLPISVDTNSSIFTKVKNYFTPGFDSNKTNFTITNSKANTNNYKAITNLKSSNATVVDNPVAFNIPNYGKVPVSQYVYGKDNPLVNLSAYFYAPYQHSEDPVISSMVSISVDNLPPGLTLNKENHFPDWVNWTIIGTPTTPTTNDTACTQLQSPNLGYWKCKITATATFPTRKSYEGNPPPLSLNINQDGSGYKIINPNTDAAHFDIVSPATSVNTFYIYIYDGFRKKNLHEIAAYDIDPINAANLIAFNKISTPSNPLNVDVSQYFYIPKTSGSITYKAELIANTTNLTDKSGAFSISNSNLSASNLKPNNIYQVKITGTDSTTGQTDSQIIYINTFA